MATATKTKKRAAKKKAAKKTNGEASVMTFRGKAAEKNEATINAWCVKQITSFLRKNPNFARAAAKDLGIELTSAIYTRDMLMEWSKAQLVNLLENSGIDPGLVRDRTVETLTAKAIENQDKLIVPAALKA